MDFLDFIVIFIDLTIILSFEVYLNWLHMREMTQPSLKLTDKEFNYSSEAGTSSEEILIHELFYKHGMTLESSDNQRPLSCTSLVHNYCSLLKIGILVGLSFYPKLFSAWFFLASLSILFRKLEIKVQEKDTKITKKSLSPITDVERRLSQKSSKNRFFSSRSLRTTGRRIIACLEALTCCSVSLVSLESLRASDLLDYLLVTSLLLWVGLSLVFSVIELTVAAVSYFWSGSSKTPKRKAKIQQSPKKRSKRDNFLQRENRNRRMSLGFGRNYRMDPAKLGGLKRRYNRMKSFRNPLNQGISLRNRLRSHRRILFKNNALADKEKAPLKRRQNQEEANEKIERNKFQGLNFRLNHNQLHRISTKKVDVYQGSSERQIDVKQGKFDSELREAKQDTERLNSKLREMRRNIISEERTPSSKDKTYKNKRKGKRQRALNSKRKSRIHRLNKKRSKKSKFMKMEDLSISGGSS